MKQSHLSSRLPLLAASLCLTLQAPAAAQESNPPQAPAESAAEARTAPRATPRAWDHETSDVPVDPRIHFGHLPNGMRYAWAHNAYPRHRVYVRLHVDVGSLAETERERGMAHFLEHMAFNGSENFPAGTLIEWFQEHGMSFGADTNAHTSFSETVYKLDLPNRDVETLRDGLRVMRDYADGLLLTEQEVQAEKGVIDGEERENDSAGFRVFKELLERQYAGTRYATRLAIGTKEARDGFDAELVRGFYERWYRPEAMTLVIVGDLRDFDPSELIAEQFASFEAPAEPVPLEPALGTPAMEEMLFHIPEEEMPGVQIFIANLEPWVDEPDTKARRIADLPLVIANQMMGLRYDEAVKKSGTPYLSAEVDEAGGLDIFDGGELAINCPPESWRPGMQAAFVELRKALQFGFRPSELEEVRADLRRFMDEAVEREGTAHSQGLLASILEAVEDGGVPTDAATSRAILAEALEALTVDECVAALRDAWSGGRLGIVALGSVELDDAEAELSRLFAEAASSKLEAPAEVETKAWAYASDPEAAGAVARREHVEDLDFTQVVFENGVRLNVKATDFNEKQVLVRINAGDGAFALSDDALPTAELLGALFTGGGLGQHSSDELRRLMAGRQVGVGLGLEPDHFAFEGATTPEDLVTEFELCCAWLTDPGYRDDLLNVIRPQLPLMFEQYRHSPQGPIRLEFLPEVLEGDPRASILNLSPSPSLAELQAVDMDDVKAALSARLPGIPLEVSIVGDVDVDAVVAAAARTFGALPERRETKPFRRSAAKIASGIEMRREIETADAKAQLLMLFPTDDGFDDARRRQTFFLGRLVDDRLRLVVREELGAAYSPFAGAQASREFEGLGAVMIQAAGDPAGADALVDACKRVARDLHENGVTQEEVDRLAEPLLNTLRDIQRQNSYWLDAIDGGQRDPARLDSTRSLVQVYQNLDAKELSALAKQWLSPERASSLLVLPKAAAKTAPVKHAGEEGDGE